jgi:hypothetical protein
MPMTSMTASSFEQRRCPLPIDVKTNGVTAINEKGRRLRNAAPVCLRFEP